MLLSELSEAQKGLIDQADRPRLGLEPPPPVQARPALEAKIARKERRTEKAEQQRLCGWLRLNAISFDQDRMDKRRTGVTGWPDFTIVHQSRVLLAELKMPGRRPSPQQEKRFAELLRGGTEVHLWHSFEEARRQIMNWFWQEFRISIPDEPS